MSQKLTWKLYCSIGMLVLSFLCIQIANGQSLYKPQVVQLTGVVVTGDSLAPVSYCNIGIKNSYRGTAADFNGFFSLVVNSDDTIVFSAIGFHRVEFSLPDTISLDHYSIIQLMSQDTIHLPETVIYPWPKPHEFKTSFLQLDIPDDKITIARKNLDRERIRQQMMNTAMDGRENYNFQMREKVKSYYHYGQPAPISIFNIANWVEFIKAWKRGDFKKE